MSPSTIRAGYKIERVYVARQEYELVLAEASLPEAEERTINFGWDWRPIKARTFEVIMQISLEPMKAAPERLSVRLIGVFSVGEGELSIPFPVFVKVNAPAILFPFAREVISTMTGRGPFGAFHLDPINVAVLTKEFDLAKTSGVKILVENSELARDFGMSYEEATRDPRLPSKT